MRPAVRAGLCARMRGCRWSGLGRVVRPVRADGSAAAAPKRDALGFPSFALRVVRRRWLQSSRELGERPSKGVCWLSVAMAERAVGQGRDGRRFGVRCGVRAPDEAVPRALHLVRCRAIQLVPERAHY
jgi:hypothetical protein